MKIVKVRIPITLVSEANVKEHWGSKARRTKAHRGAALLMVRSDLKVKGFRAEMIQMSKVITVWLTRRSPRLLDSDNLQRAFKAVRDGVADALGVDDGDHRIAWCYHQVKDSEHGVDIVIEVDTKGGAK